MVAVHHDLLTGFYPFLFAPISPLEIILSKACKGVITEQIAGILRRDYMLKSSMIILIN